MTCPNSAPASLDGVDITIIGAGVIGLAIAQNLSLWQISISNNRSLTIYLQLTELRQQLCQFGFYSFSDEFFGSIPEKICQ